MATLLVAITLDGYEGKTSCWQTQYWRQTEIQNSKWILLGGDKKPNPTFEMVKLFGRENKL